MSEETKLETATASSGFANVTAEAKQPIPQAVPAPQPVLDNNMVAIDRNRLEAILNRIDRLESAASKAGLHKYDSEHQEELGKSIKVKLIDGKVILSHIMTKNIVEKNGNNVWVEDQRILCTFEDGTQTEMPYVFFVRRYTTLPCEVVGERKSVTKEDKEKYGNNLYELKSPEGKIYMVGEKFVN